MRRHILPGDRRIGWQVLNHMSDRQMVGALMTDDAIRVCFRKMAHHAMHLQPSGGMAGGGSILVALDAKIHLVTGDTFFSVQSYGDGVTALFPKHRMIFRLFDLVTFHTGILGMA